MPRRTKEEAAQTRESLLIAARSVFSRKGYASTTLEEIAEEAGVTRGAIYWHFGSKAELYVTLLNEFSGKSARIVQGAAAEGGSMVQILRRIFERLLQAVADDPGLKEVIEISLFKTERSDELVEALQHRRQSNLALLDGIAQAMQQGIDAGELRPDVEPHDMARAFLAAQNGVIQLWLEDPTQFSLKDSARAFAELFINGVAIRSGDG